MVAHRGHAAEAEILGRQERPLYDDQAKPAHAHVGVSVVEPPPVAIVCALDRLAAVGGTTRRLSHVAVEHMAAAFQDVGVILMLDLAHEAH